MRVRLANFPSYIDPRLKLAWEKILPVYREQRRKLLFVWHDGYGREVFGSKCGTISSHDSDCVEFSDTGGCIYWESLCLIHDVTADETLYEEKPGTYEAVQRWLVERALRRQA